MTESKTKSSLFRGSKGIRHLRQSLNVLLFFPPGGGLWLKAARRRRCSPVIDHVELWEESQRSHSQGFVPCEIPGALRVQVNYFHQAMPSSAPCAAHPLIFLYPGPALGSQLCFQLGEAVWSPSSALSQGPQEEAQRHSTWILPPAWLTSKSMAGEDEGISWEAPSHWETELLHLSTGPADTERGSYQ